jgi:hypothetical protein
MEPRSAVGLGSSLPGGGGVAVEVDGSGGVGVGVGVGVDVGSKIPPVGDDEGALSGG